MPAAVKEKLGRRLSARINGFFPKKKSEEKTAEDPAAKVATSEEAAQKAPAEAAAELAGSKEAAKSAIVVADKTATAPA